MSRLPWNPALSDRKRFGKYLTRGEFEFVQGKLAQGLSFAAIAPMMVGRSALDLEKAFTASQDGPTAQHNQHLARSGGRI